MTQTTRMVRKCCVTGCKSNYLTEKEKVSVYRLPSDPEERQRWLKAIPRDNIPDKKDTVVCSKHFPPDFPVVKINGKIRPRDPPSVFNLPKSLLPTPLPPKRSTKKAGSSSRSCIDDELSTFLKNDNIPTFETLCTEFPNRKFEYETTSFTFGGDLIVQSKAFCENSGIPKYTFKVKQDFTYISYHMGVRCYIKTLTKNHITLCNKWSTIQEILRFLDSFEIDSKKHVLMQQVGAMSHGTSFGGQKYTPEMIVRGFEYFSKSRSLYNQLRKDYELPSVSTLTRLTSKVSNIEDSAFLRGVFQSLNDGQKSYILLIDEVYVKPMLSYHGGQLFGSSLSDNTQLAKTVLAFMIVCLYGGPKFLVKMLPVSKLDTDFLYNQSVMLIDQIKHSGGKLVAIICDNNRVNQAFFKKFPCSSPWKTENNVFLLFDFVHIIKSIRNNWITEKCGELEFKHHGENYVAKWEQIRKLQKLEEGNLVKMSKLTYVAANPRPIERQKVDTCMKVFCEETVNALKFHPGMADENVDGTVLFITKIIEFWKIVNVKSSFEGLRLNDSVRESISSATDLRLEALMELAELAVSMAGSNRNRVRCLTKDTSTALEHTCKGLVELVKYLLATSHSYVLLGKFTTDPLERAFGKLRQGSGGTYFINVQQVLEKFNINKTKLMLKCEIDLSTSSTFLTQDGHHCEKCSYLLSEEQYNVLDSLPQLEESLSYEVKSTLVYIAGYVTRKNECDPNDTFRYVEQYGTFTLGLDRGRLTIPGDSICEWTCFCYIMFHAVLQDVCRNSLCNIFMDIAERFMFIVERNHGKILSNIFFNNYCRLTSPISSSEPKVKVLKLSN